MTAERQAEFDALRATIRERGTVRLCAVLLGLALWAALLVAVRASQLDGFVTLTPLLVLAAAFEVSFFVHTGVERVGRYLQVFHEEAAGSRAWETIAMEYGTRFPGGLDPLFARLFGLGAVVGLFATLGAVPPWPGWRALVFLAHAGFGYRIVMARKSAAAQRVRDLERYRALCSK
jgi:hypothetical protein